MKPQTNVAWSVPIAQKNPAIRSSPLSALSLGTSVDSWASRKSAPSSPRYSSVFFFRTNGTIFCEPKNHCVEVFFFWTAHITQQKGLCNTNTNHNSSRIILWLNSVLEHLAKLLHPHSQLREHVRKLGTPQIHHDVSCLILRPEICGDQSFPVSMPKQNTIWLWVKTLVALQLNKPHPKKCFKFHFFQYVPVPAFQTNRKPFVCYIPLLIGHIPTFHNDFS